MGISAAVASGFGNQTDSIIENRIYQRISLLFSVIKFDIGIVGVR